MRQSTSLLSVIIPLHTLIYATKQIKRDRFIFKKDRKVIGKFDGISRVEVTINDKKAKMETWYMMRDENGDTGWIYSLKKDNVEKGKYKYYIEKYWIPSMRLIIKQIKELNPEVQITWSDVRKKYR